jgi:hypothetical protein
MIDYRKLIEPLEKHYLDKLAQNPARALNLLGEAVETLQREGLYHDLTEMYMLKFRVYALWSEAAKAKEVARVLKEQLETTIGRVAARKSPCYVWCTRPEGYDDWGKLGKWMPARGSVRGVFSLLLPLSSAHNRLVRSDSSELYEE